MNPAKRKKLILMGMLNQPEVVKAAETVPEPVAKVQEKVEQLPVVEVKAEEPVVTPVETVSVEEEKPQKVKKFKKVLDNQE